MKLIGLIHTISSLKGDNRTKHFGRPYWMVLMIPRRRIFSKIHYGKIHYGKIHKR